MDDFQHPNKAQIIERDLVYMENITVRFGKVLALDSVNFRVGRNEIVGLLGDNGAGKTTLVNTLIGLYKSCMGAIYFDGKQVNFKSPKDARLAGIETKHQELSLIDSMSISRNFFLGREVSRHTWKFHSHAARTKFMDQKQMHDIAAAHFKALGFGHITDFDKPLQFFSGGERQAIAIARAMYFGTKLLILDEPTAALSEDEISLVLDLVRKAKQRGLSVIFITHKANEVFQVADRFVVLQNGRNFADFKKENTNLKELEKLFIYTKLTTMRELAASVAHQVNNPLTVMKVSMEMLHDDFEVVTHREEYHKITQMLINKIDVLQNVVRNFLDFAQPLKFQKTEVSVHEVIRSALASLPLDHFQEIEIDDSQVDDTIHYVMDKNLIQQAVANLVLNALESSKPGQTVEIRAFLCYGGLCIEVRDYGVGFDEKTKKQLFNYFFSTKPSGTGLGLPIVQRIVEQHRGSISVESPPNQGALFRIKI